MVKRLWIWACRTKTDLSVQFQVIQVFLNYYQWDSNLQVSRFQLAGRFVYFLSIWVGVWVCCVMTPGLSKDILVSCMTILFLNLQISRSAWWLHMATLIFHRGLCGYVWVNMLTLSPQRSAHYSVEERHSVTLIEGSASSLLVMPNYKAMSPISYSSITFLYLWLRKEVIFLLLSVCVSVCSEDN